MPWDARVKHPSVLCLVGMRWGAGPRSDGISFLDRTMYWWIVAVTVFAIGLMAVVIELFLTGSVSRYWILTTTAAGLAILILRRWDAVATTLDQIGEWAAGIEILVLALLGLLFLVTLILRII